MKLFCDEKVKEWQILALAIVHWLLIAPYTPAKTIRNDYSRHKTDYKTTQIYLEKQTQVVR